MLPYQFFPKIRPCTVLGRVICCEFFKSDEDNGTKPSPLSFLSPEIDLYEFLATSLVKREVCFELISTLPPIET